MNALTIIRLAIALIARQPYHAETSGHALGDVQRVSANIYRVAGATYRTIDCTTTTDAGERARLSRDARGKAWIVFYAIDDHEVDGTCEISRVDAGGVQ